MNESIHPILTRIPTLLPGKAVLSSLRDAVCVFLNASIPANHAQPYRTGPLLEGCGDWPDYQSQEPGGKEVN